MANARLNPKSPVKASQLKNESFVAKNIKSFVDQGTYNQCVEQKAYELFLQRGGAQGDALQDWLEAEKIVSSEFK